MCMTVFLSYLPEAGQYSCMFLYLKQVSGLNHFVISIYIFQFCVIKEGQNTTCVLVWIKIYDQLKFTKHQTALSPPIRLQDNVNNKEVLSFLWNSSVNVHVPSECAKIFRCLYVIFVFHDNVNFFIFCFAGYTFYFRRCSNLYSSIRSFISYISGK